MKNTILVILTPIILGLGFWATLSIPAPGQKSQVSQTGVTSSGQTTSSGQVEASSPSSYRKMTTRVLDIGTHVIHLKAGVKSETFTFAKGVKGSSTSFASKGCRMGYANGHPPVRACGSARGRLAPPGENLVSFAYKVEEDTQLVITVR